MSVPAAVQAAPGESDVVPPIEYKIGQLDGKISAEPDSPDPSVSAKAAAKLGTNGVWIVRNSARWDQLYAALTESGWTPPKTSELDKIDFSSTTLVGVFCYADLGQKFSLRKHKLANITLELDLLMSYVIFKSHAPHPSFQFTLFAVPRTKQLKVSVSTYHPHNGGKYETPETAALEWQAEFGEDSGDVIEGLTGKISSSQAKIAPGQDISLLFELGYREAAQVPDGRFATKAAGVQVWDGKYSEGYRNHAFLVTTPDGQTRWLRPEVQDKWDKNAPHPVRVTAAKPYALPNWAEGSRHKSLKELGLDTAQPGKYVITGVYMELGRVDDKPPLRDGAALWGGNLATNTLIIEVAP